MATPGKLKEVIRKKLLDLTSIKVFALDEADDMIENFAGEKVMSSPGVARPIATFYVTQ